MYEIYLLSSNEINIGNMVAVANSIYPSRIDLQFSGSYRLESITTLNYSIYNSGDGSSIDRTINFTPTPKTLSGQTIYIQPLPDDLTTAGLYYIQTQFLYGNTVVYDGGVDYTYTVN